MTISHGQLQDLRARVRAMQRKIDRYKNYARIKHRKASIKPNRTFNMPATFLRTMTILNVRATFLKTWRV